MTGAGADMLTRPREAIRPEGAGVAAAQGGARQGAIAGAARGAARTAGTVRGGRTT